MRLVWYTLMALVAQFMPVDLLKKTTRFLGGARFQCLTGKIHLNGLTSIGDLHFMVSMPKAGCKLFLVGGDGVEPTDWHRKTIEQLKQTSPTVKALKSTLTEHLTGLRKLLEETGGDSEVAIELTVTDVVLDEEKKLFFLNFAANVMDVDEHGLIAIHEKSTWRLADAGYIADYISDAAVPKNKTNATPVSVIGRWSFDEEATIDLLKREGTPEKEIRSMVNHIRGMEWTITNGRFIRKHPADSQDNQITDMEIKKNRLKLGFEIPGTKQSEVWELKIVGDRIYGVWVMKKAVDVQLVAEVT